MTSHLKHAHKLHHQSSRAPEVGPRRDPKQELEGKLHPLSPSLLFASVLVLLQQRRWQQLCCHFFLLQQAFFSSFFVAAQKATATTLPLRFILVCNKPFFLYCYLCLLCYSKPSLLFLLPLPSLLQQTFFFLFFYYNVEGIIAIAFCFRLAATSLLFPFFYCNTEGVVVVAFCFRLAAVSLLFPFLYCNAEGVVVVTFWFCLIVASLLFLFFYCNAEGVVAVAFYFHLAIAKKVMAKLLSPFLLAQAFSFYLQGNDNNATITSCFGLVLPPPSLLSQAFFSFFCYSKEGDNSNVVVVAVTFYFGFATTNFSFF